MREELLGYYERELTFLRQAGAEFAQRYPKIASRLMLEPDRCEDPHTERLLEAFAFLAARVHLKVDDEFPEITAALLNLVYPQFLRPIPSMSIAEFHLDLEQGKLSTALTIPRRSMLYSRAQPDGVTCKFQTCYDTQLWPMTVEKAQWTKPDRLQPAVRGGNAVGAIRILLRCLPDVSLANLDLSSLRFHLSGESNLTHTLYELLSNNCDQIVLHDPAARPGTAPLNLSPGNLKSVGFKDDEGMLPYPQRSFVGYRLLQEYFTFPEKFLFFDLTGLDQIRGRGFKDQLEIVFLISGFERSEREEILELGVSASTFRLNCSPIVNLFPNTAEPILLDQTQFEYPVIADARRAFATEVFSIDSVVCTNPRSRETREFQPFYAQRYTSKREQNQTFWHASRRSSGLSEDDRTEIYLSLVDTSGRPLQPDADTITVHCTCTNSDVSARLPISNPAGDFELEGASSIRKITALRKPTHTLRPPIGKRAQWSLISHLSLNYLSLVQEGKDAFQQILRLYNFSDSTHLHDQIAGITSVESAPHFARIISDSGVTSARGTRVRIELDEDRFVGGGVYLFANVLEHFLGMYVSMNSFSQLVASTLQRKEALREWPPRAGRSILI